MQSSKSPTVFFCAASKMVCNKSGRQRERFLVLLNFYIFCVGRAGMNLFSFVPRRIMMLCVTFYVLWFPWFFFSFVWFSPCVRVRSIVCVCWKAWKVACPSDKWALISSLYQKSERKWKNKTMTWNIHAALDLKRHHNAIQTICQTSGHELVLCIIDSVDVALFFCFSFDVTRQNLIRDVNVIKKNQLFTCWGEMKMSIVAVIKLEKLHTHFS